MKIGMFDSGIGGLSILQETLRAYSDLDIFYIADDHHAPYGNKSVEFVRDRSKKITEQLLEKDVSLIVVACNTATAIAVDYLRKEFPKVEFVGIEPYVNIVNKAPWSHDYKAVILTTPLMHNSSRYIHLQERLDPDKKLSTYACKDLASIVEKAYHYGDKNLEAHVRNELAELIDQEFTHYILGCTHYPLVGDVIKSVTGAEIISPCQAVSNRVGEVLRIAKSVTKESATYHFFQTSHLEWVEKEIILNESLIKI